MPIQATNIKVDLTASRSRDVSLVYVHALQQPEVDDGHATAYLHWASRLAFYQDELSKAKCEGREAANFAGLVKFQSAKKEQMRPRYERDRLAFCADYIAWAGTAQPCFDLVVCCPSSREEAQFYIGPVMRAVRSRNPCALDVSQFFAKRDGLRAGAARSLQDVYDHISFDYDGSLDAHKALLVIDDVWSKGWTVGAVLSRISDSGLQADAKITVFAPLLIPRHQVRLLDGCEC